jgi:TolB-like protein/Flp pilus assembly protein TadD
MIYRFEHFELDPGRFELRAGGKARPVEPQVLELLILLAANPDRLVTRDEIVERIWHGRFVSDSAVSSRIKSARRAIGDDGEAQRLIRTVHGKGFRFVGEIAFVADRQPSSGAAISEAAVEAPRPGRQPSIAVLPFRAAAETGPHAFVADALADEIIADLARLRWLLVIARGSSFRFRRRDVDCREVGKALDVAYCATGSIEEGRGRLTIAAELLRTSDGALLWSERFSAGTHEIDEVRREIVTAIVANLKLRIAHEEADRARLQPAAALDAWGAYHLGLDHMFRFNRGDNARAAALFERALALSPHFSRALGGLSFTRFQDAFMPYAPDPQASAAEARALAEQALLCDPLDPFAHLNLGRSLWLDGDMNASIERLGQSIALSPNYAQAVYSKAWAEMTQCDAASSDSHAELALRLSPLDPLRYAMLGVRSLNALLRGDYENAAQLGERAARSPGAHKHIAVIAALGDRLAGRNEDAARWLARAREQDGGLSAAGFLRSFPFARSTGRETIEAALRDLGL